MNSKIAIISSALRAASSPEDIFGVVKSDKDINKKYKLLLSSIDKESSVLDNASVTVLKDECIKILRKFYQLAIAALKKGSYGKKPANLHVSLATKRGTFIIEKEIGLGFLSGIYLAKKSDKSYLAKVALSKSSNSFMVNERKILYSLHNGETAGLKALITIPKIIENTKIIDGNSEELEVSIFENREGFVSLEEIMQAFPQGIPSEHVGWIWNRILAAMIVSHQANVIHGAITPDHILINPKDHGGLVIGWTFASNVGSSMLGYNPAYKDYYAPEILEKKSYFSSDIYMAAMCIIKLVGGNPSTKFIPATLPSPIAALLKSCVLENPKFRPDDSYQLYNNLRDILARLYTDPKTGKFKFYEFKMPEANKK